MKTEPFREKLAAEKTTLENEMRSVGRPNAAVPNDWEPVPSEIGMQADLVDQADVVLGRESNAAILGDLEARYDVVLAALTRIDKKMYGICSVCGKTIEERRLNADPAAATCMAHL